MEAYVQHAEVASGHDEQADDAWEHMKNLEAQFRLMARAADSYNEAVKKGLIK